MQHDRIVVGLVPAARAGLGDALEGEDDAVMKALALNPRFDGRRAIFAVENRLEPG
jgi:hypothetical protein